MCEIYFIERVPLLLCEHSVDLLVVLPCTEDYSDNDVHTHKRCTAGTYERERNTDNRKYLEYHADVENTVCEDYRESTDADVSAKLVAGYKTVCYQFDADESKNHDECEASDKSEYVAYIGENEVVVDFRNIALSVSEKLESLSFPVLGRTCNTSRYSPQCVIKTLLHKKAISAAYC